MTDFSQSELYRYNNSADETLSPVSKRHRITLNEEGRGRRDRKTHSVNPTLTPNHNPYNLHPNPNAVPNANGSATI